MKKLQLGTVIHSLNTGLNPRKFFQLNTPDAEFYYVTIKEMVDGKIVYNENTDRLNGKALELCNRRSNLEKGDVLFSGTGTIGKTVVLTETPTTWNIKEGVYTIKPKQDLLNSNYLSYVLSSESIKNNYMTNVAGGTVKSLKMADLEKTVIPLPPLLEQQKIVAELDTIQSAIDNKKQQLALLDEAVKSEFVEMFGDPIFNSKNFPTKKVIDVVTMQRGYDLPVQNRGCTGKIPVFGSNGILGNHNLAKMNKGIITGRSGTIGEVYMCETPFWPLNTTLFSKDTHGNNICYLKFLLEFFDLKRFKSGVGIPTLNRNEFHDEQIIDVPLDLQNQFAAFVQQIDKSKFVLHQQLQFTEKYAIMFKKIK